MPPPDCIEISDDEGRKTGVVSLPRPIRALAIVVDINARIEKANSAIKAHKDDVVHLKKLLRSAEERLEKEQEGRLKLIEKKSEALNSGVIEINARSGLGGGGVKIEVKDEVKHEPRVKREETGREIRQKSIFLGVQVPVAPDGRFSSSNSPRSIKLDSSTPATRKPSSTQEKRTVPPIPPPPPPPPPQTTRINGGWDDSNSDGNVPMGDYDSTGDSDLLSPLPRAKPPRTVPTRGKGWRGGRGFGRAVGSRGPTGSIPQDSKSFRRDTISLVIGGQLQHTWPTPDQNGNYAIKVVRYCCLRRELNWCSPSRPGASENALMFSSRPFDWDGADFPLFIREQISGTGWKYYGDYRITECCTVSLQEWRSFKETQKIAWCKHMLSNKGVLAKRFREGELGRDDWRKVYDLFEREDTNSRHLRITARKLEFARYNRKLYDLLEERSTIPAAKKRKVTRDDVEIGSADDDYSQDDDIPPQSAVEKRARRKRNRVSYIEPTLDSEDNDDAPGLSHPPHLVQEVQTIRVKEELLDDDDDDLYSAPSMHGARLGETGPRFSQPGPRRSLPDGGSDRDSSVEMWEKEPEPWVKPTKDNDMIAVSDDPHKKFDSNQLIRVWEPPILDNLPKFPTTKFSRRFLSTFIGGCEQVQECVVSESKKRDQIYKIGVYYCERTEWAPDLPGKAGAHGVVYGTKCDDSLVDYNYSSYPVFCRRKANEWEYCGEYQITRRGFVSGEWSRVAPVAKKSWSEGFAGKRGKWGVAYMIRNGIITPGQKVTAQEVLEFIEQGLIQLECQVYKCVGYDRKFYDTLDAKMREQSGKGQVAKQEMLDDED